MMKANIYYWKDTRWMIRLGSEDHPDHPTKDDIRKDYVKLPIELEIPDNIKERDLTDYVFQIMNNANSEIKNPMGTPQMQEWLKKHGLHHTSMSVADIIEYQIDGTKKMQICEEFGWTDLT